MYNTVGYSYMSMKNCPEIGHEVEMIIKINFGFHQNKCLYVLQGKTYHIHELIH